MATPFPDFIKSMISAMAASNGIDAESIVVVPLTTLLLEGECQCPDCRKTTVAERLLELAEFIRYPRDELLLPGVNRPKLKDDSIGNIKLALDFHAKGPAFHFTAIYEEWDREQLIRRLRT